MTQADFNREYDNQQIRSQNNEIIRREQHEAERRGMRRAQDSHTVATTLSVLAASLWVISVVALYDVIVAQLPLMESLVAAVPDSWLRPDGWGIVVNAAIAVAIAMPLFIVAFVLKKVRTVVGYHFPLSLWSVLPLWCWMVVMTTVRAVIDLLGLAAAWVAFQLLRGVQVNPVTELGTEALWAALLFIVPAAAVRAFVLTHQSRSAE